MPNRILREGILTSERVASLSWAAEVFYRRLMSVVDDYGRYYATPVLIRARCYPLLLDKVPDSDIGKWMTECSEAGLVRVYRAQDRKWYVEIVRFNQRIQAKSKFPDPCPSVGDGDPPWFTVNHRLVGGGGEGVREDPQHVVRVFSKS